jgi:exodeoxyribonuclease VII large subunit
LEVVAKGRVTTYPDKSKYQIVIDELEPAGIGALMALLEQRKTMLAAEGLFHEARKKKLPYLPRIVGVVTSPTGSVIRDILHRLSDRFPCHVLVWPVRVQGETCAAEVAAAIAGFNALMIGASVPRPDLIIVARGGGSLEDLWTFNEEAVARAIVASRLPVVSAIGHEIDVTIADLAADFRAMTPSEAGERCVPDARDVRRDLDHLAARLDHTGRSLVNEARARLDRLSDRASRALRRDLDGRRHHLARLAASLEALSPLAVLARGYSLTLKDGNVLRAAADAQPGDLIQTRLARGTIISRVLEITES